MSLTSNTPSNTYLDLLYMNNSNIGLDSVLRPVYSGSGTASPLKLSNSAVALSGSTWPSTTGTNGYVLTTNGAGTLSWQLAVNIVGTTNEITVTNGTGIGGNPTIAITNNPVIPGNGSITIPVGTTAQRPGSPTTGMMRYNSDVSMYETYQSGNWISFTDSVQSITYSSSITINWDLGDYAIVILSGATTTINMTGYRTRVILILVQDSTGSRTVTWGPNVRFGTDIPSVTLSTAPTYEDKIGFIRDPISGTYDCVSYARGF